MSSYLSATEMYTDVIFRLTSTVVGTSTIEGHITDMTALVDSFLAERYSLPLSNTPPIIKKVTKDLTAYEVLRSQYVNDNQNQNTWVYQYREDALSLLKMIKDGRICLVHSNTVIQPIANINIKTNMSGIPLMVNMDGEFEWHEPEQLLDAIDEARESAD